MSENSYGIEKRLIFLCNSIKQLNPKSVMDMGCGTGTNVTSPLAERFPNIKFLGVDADKDSIEYARTHKTLSNLDYAHPKDLVQQEKFDLIIASEVIEHVEHPEKFLMFLKDKLIYGGKIILTLPNGYGPFELASLIDDLMHLVGMHEIIRNIKRVLIRTSSSGVAANQDTLAISPHINFFSYNEICKLLRDSGLVILDYHPRTFLCGFGFDQLLRGEVLTTWNAHITDFLPAYLSSDWMFVLGKNESPAMPGFKRGIYARFRRHIKEKTLQLKLNAANTSALR